MEQIKYMCAFPNEDRKECDNTCKYYETCIRKDTKCIELTDNDIDIESTLSDDKLINELSKLEYEMRDDDTFQCITDAISSIKSHQVCDLTYAEQRKDVVLFLHKYLGDGYVVQEVKRILDIK